MCVRKTIFAWELWHYPSVCLCVLTCLLCPEMTVERFASIFEQSALASLSVEAMLFLRV